ncbi:VPLPA-CTERM sorting domain-containing protein [Massilia pinisoli]|uniref:VPLPA-CTERM sorting domain-containing protein n=1 Tax=Massilia pinisoli TaxID=1772194 RepID=A0ABT1ZSY1_9BURK|nr:VPLPA-CTERM sorting domain-containing protein [Massilia pinisoli]MCS0582769.1 VPLPA-CTERM sorting domain-containing protein [Massilia pinisoli]
MTLKAILAALALGVAAANAGATVLTFDSLTESMYGDGFPLAANMHYDGTNLVYEESGFRVTLNAPGAAAGAAHVGDGTFDSQTYNWHDGFENGANTFVTLTRIGGGQFDLRSFDYYTVGGALSTDGTLQALLQGGGTWDTALNGITELRFTSGAANAIANVDVDAASTVPLPGTLPLLMGGMAAFGLARRRRV